LTPDRSKVANLPEGVVPRFDVAALAESLAEKNEAPPLALVRVGRLSLSERRLAITRFALIPHTLSRSCPFPDRHYKQDLWERETPCIAVGVGDEVDVEGETAILVDVRDIADTEADIRPRASEPVTGASIGRMYSPICGPNRSRFRVSAVFDPGAGGCREPPGEQAGFPRAAGALSAGRTPPARVTKTAMPQRQKNESWRSGDRGKAIRQSPGMVGDHRFWVLGAAPHPCYFYL
jgi:hypothetical protein